jgi:hypothetical protein
MPGRGISGGSRSPVDAGNVAIERLHHSKDNLSHNAPREWGWRVAPGLLDTER